MDANSFTLRTTINRQKEWYFKKYGGLDWQWKDEGLIWAIQDYHSCKGSLEDFTEDDWKAVEENGLTKEEIKYFCESE